MTNEDIAKKRVAPARKSPLKKPARKNAAAKIDATGKAAAQVVVPVRTSLRAGDETGATAI